MKNDNKTEILRLNSPKCGQLIPCIISAIVASCWFFSANHSLNSLNSSFLRSVENQLAADAAGRLRMRDERYTHGFWDAVHVDEVIINVDVASDYVITTAVLVVMLDSPQQSVSFLFVALICMRSFLPVAFEVGADDGRRRPQDFFQGWAVRGSERWKFPPGAEP